MGTEKFRQISASSPTATTGTPTSIFTERGSERL
jgi:hypothetical protein